MLPDVKTLTSLANCLDAFECPLFAEFGVLGDHRAEDIQTGQVFIQPQSVELLWAGGWRRLWRLGHGTGTGLL